MQGHASGPVTQAMCRAQTPQCRPSTVCIVLSSLNIDSPTILRLVGPPSEHPRLTLCTNRDNARIHCRLARVHGYLLRALLVHCAAEQARARRRVLRQAERAAHYRVDWPARVHDRFVFIYLFCVFLFVDAKLYVCRPHLFPRHPHVVRKSGRGLQHLHHRGRLELAGSRCSRQQRLHQCVSSVLASVRKLIVGSGLRGIRLLRYPSRLLTCKVPCHQDGEAMRGNSHDLISDYSYRIAERISHYIVALR